MIARAEVEAFLGVFKTKLEVFDVIFMNRDKNLQALVDLEISCISRKEILKGLAVEDYFRGPTRDVDGGPALWEFGKTVNKKEVYIKITVGNLSRPVICISFHVAERAMAYPLKKTV